MYILCSIVFVYIYTVYHIHMTWFSHIDFHMLIGGHEMCLVLVTAVQFDAFRAQTRPYFNRAASQSWRSGRRERVRFSIFWFWFLFWFLTFFRKGLPKLRCLNRQAFKRNWRSILFALTTMNKQHGNKIEFFWQLQFNFSLISFAFFGSFNSIQFNHSDSFVFIRCSWGAMNP